MKRRMADHLLESWSGDLWGHFGLTGNPYFRDPLTPELMKLFRGESREAAAKAILRHIDAGDAPYVLLESGPGLGKTSLVNFVKHALVSSGRYYVYPGTLEISEESTRESIAAEYINALVVAAFESDATIDWTLDERWKTASKMVSDHIEHIPLRSKEEHFIVRVDMSVTVWFNRLAITIDCRNSCLN